MSDLAAASLAIWAVRVELGGRVYTIPPLPAARWMLAILNAEEPFPVVPGLLGHEAEEEVLEALMTGAVSVDDLVRANRDALCAASGWPWWEADRLVRSAAQHWRQVGGELAIHGVDPRSMPLGTVLNAIYALVVRDMTREQRFSFDVQLTAPPPGMSAAELYDEQFYANSFEEAMRERPSLA